MSDTKWNSADCDISGSALFSFIEACNWDRVMDCLISFEEEIHTWVIKSSDKSGGLVIWRRLPIHELCIKGAPIEIIDKALKIYPEGAKAADLFGRTPLHHACFNDASIIVVERIFEAFPEAIETEDIWGFKPFLPSTRAHEIPDSLAFCLPVKEVALVSKALEAENIAIQEAELELDEKIISTGEKSADVDFKSEEQDERLNKNCDRIAREIEAENEMCIVGDKNAQNKELIGKKKGSQTRRYIELYEKYHSEKLSKNDVDSSLNRNITKDFKDMETDFEDDDDELIESILETYSITNDELEGQITEQNYDPEKTSFVKVTDIKSYFETEAKNDHTKKDILEDQLQKIVENYGNLKESLEEQQRQAQILEQTEIEAKHLIIQLEKKVEEDAAVIENQNEMIAQLNEAYVENQEKINCLVEELEETRCRYSALYDEYVRVLSKVQESEVKSEASKQKKLEKENYANEQLSNEMGKLTRLNDQLQKEVKLMSTKASALEMKLKEYENGQQLMLLTDDQKKEDYKKKLEIEKAKCQDLEVKLRFASSKISLLENERMEQAQSNVDFKKERATSLKELSNLSIENDQLRQDLSLNSSIIALFKVKAKEDNNRIATLEESITILKDALMEQKDKYRQIYAEYHSKATKLSDLEDKYRDMESKAKQIENENYTLREALEDQRLKYEILEKKLCSPKESSTNIKAQNIFQEQLHNDVVSEEETREEIEERRGVIRSMVKKYSIESNNERDEAPSTKYSERFNSNQSENLEQYNSRMISKNTTSKSTNYSRDINEEVIEALSGDKLLASKGTREMVSNKDDHDRNPHANDSSVCSSEEFFKKTITKQEDGKNDLSQKPIWGVRLRQTGRDMNV